MKSTIMKKNTHIKERYSSHQEVAEESLTSILPPERAGRKRERGEKERGIVDWQLGIISARDSPPSAHRCSFLFSEIRIS